MVLDVVKLIQVSEGSCDNSFNSSSVSDEGNGRFTLKSSIVWYMGCATRTECRHSSSCHFAVCLLAFNLSLSLSLSLSLCLSLSGGGGGVE